MVSLRIRHEQLIRLDFHQLDCSLVGCSDVPDKLTFLTTGPRKAHMIKSWIAMINNGWFDFLSRQPTNDQLISGSRAETAVGLGQVT